MKSLIIVLVSICCFFLVVKETVALKPPADCLEPYGQGACRGRMPAYAYDSDRKECVQYIYGGCGETANHFISKEDCESKCWEGAEV